MIVFCHVNLQTNYEKYWYLDFIYLKNSVTRFPLRINFIHTGARANPNVCSVRKGPTKQVMMKIWWMSRELSFLVMIRSTDSAMKTPTNRRTRRSAHPEITIIRSCRVKESLFKTNNIDKQRMPTNVVLHFLLDWNLLKCVVNRMIMKIIHNREYQWNIFLQLLIFCITIVKMFIVREFLSLVGADPVSRDILLSWSCRCEVTHFYQGFCTLFHCYLFNVKTVGNSKDFDDKICHTISWIRHNILILIPANNAVV